METKRAESLIHTIYKQIQLNENFIKNEESEALKCAWEQLLIASEIILNLSFIFWRISILLTFKLEFIYT